MVNTRLISLLFLIPTHLLIEKTQGSYLRYAKKSLNQAYLQDAVAGKIVKVIKDIDFS